ncbi:MAG: hypothetical protein K0S29_241 [Gammaproteobacteria bacterium]|jgi:hypothetical protein|nr:hypothetical protein [Gammaproteobacteria bacterium]
MHIELFIPDLVFNRPGHAAGLHPLFELELPSLSLLLDGAVKSDSLIDEEYCLAESCGLDINPPYGIAALTAELEGLPAKIGCWLRADPVRMQVGQETVYCLGQQDLHISSEEAKSLIDDVNTLLQEDNLNLMMGDNPMHWYLLIEARDFQTTALSRVIAKPIRDYLPQGIAGRLWQKRLTEIQMLLKAHPVNIKRQNLGLAAVDSVWFWGEGEYPKLSYQRKDVLFGDDSFAQAVALAANLAYRPIPENLDEILSGPYQKIILIDHRLRWALAKGSLEQWQCQVVNLEKKLFLPLLLALKNKKLDRIIFNFCNSVSFHIARSSLKKWWQRTQSLQDRLCKP